MTQAEETFSVDIPLAELPANFTPPAVAREPKPRAEPKADPVVAAKDTRDDDLKASREALAQAHADRDRLSKELVTEREKVGTITGHAVDLVKDNHKKTAQTLYSRGEAAYAEHQQIVNAIHATKMETSAAKKELEDALADDNIDARERARRIADAQERMTAALRDSGELEHGKSQVEHKLQEAQRQFEAHMRNRPSAEEPAPPQREERKPEPEVKQPEVDPFEKYVGQFPSDSQKWLREHPEYVKDQRLNKRLQAAALEWDAEGKQLHTSEFIQALNDKFFKKEDEVTEEEDDGQAEEVEVAPAPAPKAKSTPAAPVSRSTSPARSSDKKGNMKVSLTVPERDHAIQMFGPGTRRNMTPENAMKQYAQYRLQAQADGKYEPR